MKPKNQLSDAALDVQIQTLIAYIEGYLHCDIVLGEGDVFLISIPEKEDDGLNQIKFNSKVKLYEFLNNMYEVIKMSIDQNRSY